MYVEEAASCCFPPCTLLLRPALAQFLRPMMKEVLLIRIENFPVNRDSEVLWQCVMRALWQPSNGPPPLLACLLVSSLALLQAYKLATKFLSTIESAWEEAEVWAPGPGEGSLR